MVDPVCRDVRIYLKALAAGGPVPSPAAGVWDALATNGAVQGSAATPEITPVGRHVLGELEVRAERTDAMPLSRVATMLDRLLVEFDEVAKTAEYFLADLGPVTPPEALPLLRPVAVGLANRRETPEEIAEEFRNIWGGVEVMGGDARDRLLAAELLNAASANMEKVYSPVMNTTERIRTKLGPKGRSVTPATILHLTAGVDQPIALDAFFDLRPKAGSDEAAALLAAISSDAGSALARRDELLRELGASASSPDALHAATYLAAVGADAEAVQRTRALSGALGDRMADRLTSAALLSSLGRLPPAEIMNWLDKAVDILTARQLAPTRAEMTVLAVALLHGLPEAEFFSPSPKEKRPAPGPPSLPALTAIHAWVYRPLVGPAGAVASAAPSG